MSVNAVLSAYRNGTSLEKAAIIALAIGFAWGLIMRLLPLVQGADTLVQRFISEDGYLMLTVARNMAIGLGMSVSEGTMGTNGVQPLATFLYTIPYVLTGGSKVGGIAGVMVMMAGFAAVGALIIFRFARKTLSMQATSALWAAGIALWWFVSAAPLAHTMNALETGMYVAIAALTVTVFGDITARGGGYTSRDQWILGGLCGLCFLARIDGAFLVTALFGVRFFSVLLTGQLNLRQAIIEALPPGFLSLGIAAPWLVHNQLRFGSIMPISGPAQSFDAEFGAHVALLPSKLIEHMIVLIPIPNEIENNAFVIALTTLTVLGVVGVFLWRQFADRSPMRYAALGYTVFGIFLSVYYGLFFGAAHFLPRYTFPLSPFLITAGVSTALYLLRFLPSIGRTVPAAGLALAIVLTSSFSTQNFVLTPAKHGHFQVVGWVDDNVPESTWVGAVQTGTLGYWHDRTINLDGKVNPDALTARMEDGHVLNYVAASEVDVLADWAPIAHWPLDNQPQEFSEVFEPIVDDRRQNLGIQIRRGVDLTAAAGQE